MVERSKGMTAFSWLDGNPVHFLTTADGTATTQVPRRVGRQRTNVTAPIAIKKYNHGMQAVDRHDQLRAKFSLSKRHLFKKYYVKLALGLMDMAIVNANIHWNLVNPHSHDSQNDFINTLAEQLIGTQWQQHDGSVLANDAPDIFDSLNEGDNTSDFEEEGYELLNADQHIAGSVCNPRAVKQLLVGHLSKKKGLGCQVCNFEGRGEGIVGSVVVCLKHRIRCCTQTREQPNLKKLDGSYVTDYGWMPQQKNMSCWEKAHSFYIPKGLFRDNVGHISPDDFIMDNLTNLRYQCIRVGCDLNKRKRAALGNAMKKRGNKKRKMAETTTTTTDELTLAEVSVPTPVEIPHLGKEQQE
jgi:hypothetical protein